MAAIRALLILLAILGFFLVGTPLQWLVSRRAPRLADRIPLLFCRSLLWLAKVRLVTTGTRVTGRPVLVAANHVSWIDILALGAVTPFCFLAKSDVAGWPIVSAFADVQGTVFVDRRRRRAIPGANRRMAERMRAGRPVLLFPEGTTVAGPEPAPFHSSHFAAAHDLLALSPDVGEVAVQPVAVAYSSDAAAWVGDDDLLASAANPSGATSHCFISFGAPISFGPTSDRKAVARTARAAVVAMLRARRVEAADPVALGRLAARPSTEGA